MMSPAAQEELELRFASAVRRLREKRGWSQFQLSRLMTAHGFAGFHQTTISRIEKNERPVRIGEATGLAEVLGSTVTQMLAPGPEPISFEKVRSQYEKLAKLRFDLVAHYLDWDAEQKLLRKALQEFDESGADIDWAEGNLKDELETLLRKARVAANEPLQALVEEGNEYIAMAERENSEE